MCRYGQIIKFGKSSAHQLCGRVAATGIISLGCGSDINQVLWSLTTTSSAVCSRGFELEPTTGRSGREGCFHSQIGAEFGEFGATAVSSKRLFHQRVRDRVTPFVFEPGDDRWVISGDSFPLRFVIALIATVIKNWRMFIVCYYRNRLKPSRFLHLLRKE